MVTENFKEICELKVSILKGGCSTIATLICNSWLKDVDMCVCKRKFTDNEAVQIVEDFTTDHTCGTVEFYLNVNEEWNNSELIEHLRTSFESAETFRSFLGKSMAETKTPRTPISVQ